MTTERVARLRDKMLRGEHWNHRVLFPREWDTGGLDLSLPERKASVFKLMLESMPVFIDDDELIVGSRTAFAPVDSAREEVCDPSKDFTLLGYPRYLTDEERSAVYCEGLTKMHFVPGFAKVFRLGFGGIIEEASDRLRVESDAAKIDFLKSVVIAFEGAAALANRYADLAERLAGSAVGARREELLRISDACRWVSLNPPRDLQEALQLYWFTQLITKIEHGALVSFGRFDQLIEPYWNTCPQSQSQELLECLMVKINDTSDIPGESLSGTDQMMLGGLRPDGTDGTNEVTYACLDALDHLRMVDPLMSVRIHSGTSSDLLARAIDLARQGLSQVAFYNDDVFVPALHSAGFALEDCRDYALDACQDVLIPGCSDFFLGGAVLLTQILVEMLDKVPDDATYDELLCAYKSEIARKIEECAAVYRASVANPDPMTTLAPSPFLSGTVDSCIEKGLDIACGGVRYRDKGIFLMSPVNAINGLAALKKVVYDEKLATFADVKRACNQNYVGFERIRRQLLNAPKWGCDNEYVDLIGKDLIEFSSRVIKSQRIDDDAGFLSGVHQPHHVNDALNVGASPDGRLAGQPFPVTLAPANGTDTAGATAIMKSVTKIDPMVFQWNHSLTLSFHMPSVSGDDVLPKLVSLVRAYFRMGGPQLQFSVVDVDVLRAAQKDPASYRDVFVRVWGYSARFVDLSPRYQEDIIGRTAHSV